MPEFLFRTDANAEMGAGHLARCTGLIECLRQQGGDCAIYGNVSNEFRFMLGLNSPMAVTPIGNPVPDYKVLVVDNYNELNNQLAELAVCNARRIVLFEDMDDRTSSLVDVVINPFGNPENLRQRFPKAAIHTGLEFYIPRYQVWLQKERMSKRLRLNPNSPLNSKVQPKAQPKVVVSLGGSSHPELEQKIVEVLISGLPNDAQIEVFSAYNESKQLNNIRYNSGFAGDFLEAASSADLVVCGAGQTLLEMVYCQRPVIGVFIADNQRRCAETLVEFGVPVINRSSDLTEEISRCLNQLQHGERLQYPEHIGSGVDQLVNNLLSLVK